MIAGRRIVANPATLAGLLLALAGLAAPAVAAPSADGAERARIAAERSALDARFAERERECRQRFVVTSCVDDARRERRRGLDGLKARQLQLDEAKRRARTEERRAELAAKAADDAKRERAARNGPASAPAARDDGLPHGLEPRHDGAASDVPRLGVLRDHRGSGSGAGLTSGHAEPAEVRQTREARSRASFAARQQQAAEHREEVLDKTVKAMKDRRPGATLPLPASAAGR
jgi:colicin import membrane protein